jgi:hypothetical protein
MATTNQRRKHRKGITLSWASLRWVGIAALAALLALALWKGPGLRQDALAGASFGAHVACSCRFIENRSLNQCKADFEPGMGMIMLSENSSAKSVTARFPLLASQTATFRAGEGCVLEKWGE